MDTRESYDRVAAEYAQRYCDEMADKPFDRVMLDWLVEKVDGRGPICDMGCGPGQIARYLHGQGADVWGVDLSPAMVAEAQRLNPEIPFQQGDMLALSEIADGTFGGIAAFYSIIHVPRASVVDALRELRRVLCSGGVLLLTFHIGTQTKHLDEWWGKAVELDFRFFEVDEMLGWLDRAGFEREEAIERAPYPEEIEVQTRRAYLFARKAPLN